MKDRQARPRVGIGGGGGGERGAGRNNTWSQIERLWLYNSLVRRERKSHGRLNIRLANGWTRTLNQWDRRRTQSCCRWRIGWAVCCLGRNGGSAPPWRRRTPPLRRSWRPVTSLPTTPWRPSAASASAATTGTRRPIPGKWPRLEKNNRYNTTKSSSNSIKQAWKKNRR